MNEKFYDLKKEKQDRIINGALKIFALNGYKHASTDDIIAEARISKGLLFHYFGSKIGLYEFLFGYASRFAVVELRSGVSRSERDYFEIQRRITASEAALEVQYPYITMFLDSVLRETCEEALSAIADSRTLVALCYEELLSAADLTLFQNEDDADKLTQIISYTKQGLLRAHLGDPLYRPKDMEDEIDNLLDFLRAHFFARES
ncbi:TetR/AcrR family transcriptional regulator [Lachnoclostridium sp. Marseille-P6806]|uniref:TetR/AcrR family transcriptional regulator n=1 Tax=Lachnoclostridium sp. Marseille-P6806 TaxID=2364793 RepID=UPI001030A282|nr:TetR/AcrR family transcriptional regulator [Lachnoclostridium sp. Marseille-P6806]